MTEAGRKILARLSWATLIAISLAAVACKELPKKPISKPVQDVPKFTGTAHAQIKPATTSTSETSLSTSETSGSTEEWGASTEETSVASMAEATPESLYLVRPIKFYTTLDPLKMGGMLTKTNKILVKPSNKTTEEYWLVSIEAREVYVHRDDVCGDMVCIMPLRRGVVNVFFNADNIRSPQIQLKVTNLKIRPIEDLRLSAKFYYKGEPVGEDQAYIAADTQGFDPLKPDQSKTVYMRAPGFNMPKKDVLSPDNPVKIELFCALESFVYNPCGEFYIDRMYY